MCRMTALRSGEACGDAATDGNRAIASPIADITPETVNVRKDSAIGNARRELHLPEFSHPINTAEWKSLQPANRRDSL